MRSIGVSEFGCASNLRIFERNDPFPGPGEVLIKLAFAGVNFIDVYMRSGVYSRSDTYKTPLPLMLGMEGGGEVLASGPGVEDIRPGDRVACCLSRGSYSDLAVVPAHRCVKVPPDIPMDAAVARARGADRVILYRDEDFLKKTRELTDGRGVNLVYDSVGRDTVARSIRCLSVRGTCVLFGASSGVVSSIDPLELAEAGSVYFTRPHLADYMRDADEIRGRADDLFGSLRSGALTVEIDSVFPFEETAAAHRRLEARQTRGKILIDVASVSVRREADLADGATGRVGP